MRLTLALLGLLMLPLSASAEPVDVELVLAADGSGSIDNDELAFQREGWAKAIESPDVLQAIRNGAHGKIAILYLEWGGPTSQHVIVDWHVVSDLESAQRFGDRLRSEPRAARGYNSISAAIDFSVNLIEGNGYQGLKKVIDVSGDGPNIGGPPIEVSRQAAVDKGFTINALAIKRPGGSYRSPDGRPLEDYYADYVIGGAGAFVEIANADRPFADAARRKLVLELAAIPRTRLVSR